MGNEKNEKRKSNLLKTILKLARLCSGAFRVVSWLDELKSRDLFHSKHETYV